MASSLFVIASPFVIGAIHRLSDEFFRTATWALRNTNILLAAATGMAAIGLVAAALEGIVCIILIRPAGVRSGSSSAACWVAPSPTRLPTLPPHQMLTGFAILPLMFAL